MKTKRVFLGMALASALTVHADDCIRQGNYCFTDHLIVAAPEASAKVLQRFPGGRFLFRSSTEDPIEKRNWQERGIAQLNWYRIATGDLGMRAKTVIQDDKPWDIAYKLLLSRELAAEFKRQGVSPVIAEPDIVYHNETFAKKYQKLDTKGFARGTSRVSAQKARREADGPIPADIVKPPKTVWPSGEPGWHLGKAYTNLHAAIQHVGDVGDEKRVAIAHLDTGCDREDELLPQYFDEQASRDFTSDDPSVDYKCEPEQKPVHGARTLSTLAGNAVQLPANDGGSLYEGKVGGSPYVRVFEYKIGNLVFHLAPSDMATAIAYAAEANADVVSLSAGGLPSVALRKAVNKAYGEGTAIFAATGDFFVLPFTSFTLTPSTVVFPARFNRVIGVAGVTERRKSYGKAPCYLCLLKFWEWNKSLLSWTLRGSYGPASVMGGHVVAAYSPNILHSWPSQSDESAVALDGAGTSHSTPQVAAAASLWLQHHRDDLEQENAWNNWKKVEAVYQALIRSAEKPAGYAVKHMGEGVLNAERLLKVTIDPNTLKKRDKDTIGVKWLWDLVASWDLLPIFKELLDGRKDNVLEDALREMMVTEIQQIIFESKSGQKLLDEHAGCAQRETEEEMKDCRDEVGAEFEDILLKSDIRSEFLKAAIQGTLAQWLAENT